MSVTQRRALWGDTVATRRSQTPSVALKRTRFERIVKANDVWDGAAGPLKCSRCGKESPSIAVEASHARWHEEMWAASIASARAAREADAATRRPE